jgi:DNA-binding transcriptional LysR family regulator
MEKKARRALPVTLHQLRVFEAVARCGSFTRAAEQLHLAQPTVSIQVRQLAEAVGMPLFEQIGKKIFLTEAGRALQGSSSELFDVWERFEMRVADLKGMKKGTLRLSTVTTAKYFVPRLLGPFCRLYPEIDVRLEVGNRSSIVERLTRNEDDLYIMGVPPRQFDIVKHPFMENPLVVVAPAGHPLAGRRRVPLKRLASEPFLLREPGSGTRMAGDRFLRDRGLRLDVKMELGSNEAIKQAVAGGLGLALLSLHALGPEALAGSLAILDVQGFPIRRSWYIVYPEGKRLSVVAQTFHEYLKGQGAQLRTEHLASLSQPGTRQIA